MVEKLRFEKAFFPITKYAKSDENSEYLGYIEGIAASNHLDHYEDIITESALRKGAVSLKANCTVFFNHDWNGLPVGKVIESEYFEDGEFKGIRVKVGISKSAPQIMTLCEEGILRSFSIGGFFLEYEIKEEVKDGKTKLIGYVKDMETLEVSVVGIPANNTARFDLSQKMIKAMSELKSDYLSKKKNMVKKMETDEQITQLKSELGTVNKTVSDLATAVGSLVKGLQEQEAFSTPARATPVAEEQPVIKEITFNSEHDELIKGFEQFGIFMKSPEKHYITLEGSMNAPFKF